MESQEWNERYSATDLLWSAGPNRFVAEQSADLTPGRALDLAAGEGRNALWLAERGWQVTAVDFSSVAVERGRKIADSRGLSVEWLVRDLNEWKPPSRAFDLVVVAYLQIPQVEREPIWAAAAAAVAPGGTLIVIAHDSRNLSDGHGGPQSADVLHTADDVIDTVTDLEVAVAGEVYRDVETSDGSTAQAIDCLVVARRPS